VLVALLGAWQLVVSLGLVKSFWISSPILIAERLAQEGLRGDLWYHLWVTLEEALVGLAVGAGVGVALGLLLGVSRTIGQIFEPFIIALNSLPRVALGPLLVMFVGIGFASKFLLAFSLVVVPVMLNTYEGVRSVEQTLVNVMRTLEASRAQLFFKLLIPNCIPWILSALRSAVSFAIIGAIVGEFISSRAGIGYLIDTASGSFDTTGVIVPLLVLMVLGYILDSVIVVVSAHLLRWRTVELS
jgi:NitT/TauT family transport system permease protein